jgi:transposase InsO family protein
MAEMLIVNQVIEIRKHHRVMGTRKLYELLYPFMLEHQIKMGRDALFDCLAKHYLLVRKRKRKISTTMSHHHYYKWTNLAKDLVITGPNQLYVSDITYWKQGEVLVYVNLITDAYSHKIVGYHAALTLEAVESIKALNMALSPLTKHQMDNLMHHSDRGIQYCCSKYIEILQSNNIKISMTERSEPTDNAIAERVNGILKEEYLRFYQIKDCEHAQQLLTEAIRLYNDERPHMSIGNLTPTHVHQTGIETEKLWKKYPYRAKEVPQH